VISSDAFNRANSVTLGSNWHEPAGFDNFEIEAYCPNGTPTILQGAIVTPYDTGPSGAIWEEPHPEPSASMHARIYTLNDHLLSGTGLSVSLLLGVEFNPVTKVLGAMHVATLTLDDPMVITLSTRVGMDGAATGIASEEVVGETIGHLDPDRAGICVPPYRRLFIATLNDSVFCASISDAVLSAVYGNSDFSLYTGGSDRWYTGIGSGSLEPPAEEKELYLDEWEWWQAFETHEDCPMCSCDCDGIVLPAELTVTARATGCMSPADGKTTTLTWDRLTGNWTGRMTFSCPYGTIDWDITLTCPEIGSDPEDFTLIIVGECFDSDDCRDGPINQRLATEADSTCDPLFLSFGCPPGTQSGDCDHDSFFVYESDLACSCCSLSTGSFCYEVSA